MKPENLAYEKQLIGDIWTSDEPYRNLEELSDVIGSRWAGSASEHTAGEWLADKMRAYGLQNVRLEPIEFGAWTRGKQELSIVAPFEKSFSCLALPYCPAGEVEAELIDVGNGEEEDYERLGDAVKGKIVITAAETNPLGTRSSKLSHRTDKLRFAVDAGAVGFIFVNQNPGLLHITGSIANAGGTPADIISVGTSWEHGQTILRLAKRAGEPVTVRITTGGEFFANTSYNVVGEIPGSKWPEQLVIAGGHYDGHDVSQASLDDGTGTVTTLEVGRVLAALPPEAIGCTIRLILFCGEEVGLFGSWGYVANHLDELPNIRFMLNLDGAGQGKGGAEKITISGRPELLDFMEAYRDTTKYKLTIVDQLNSHSDHYPFAIRGVPTATLNSPDDSATLVGRGWGHTEADTFDKIQLRGLQMASMATARLLLDVASVDEFPAALKPREDLQKQLEETGLDTALKRANRWDLVGNLEG